FVGRKEELKTLKAMIQRAPVAVVWGLEGLGKTALAIHALHKHFRRQVPRTLHVRAQADSNPQALMMQVIRAIAQAEGLQEIDWAAVAQEPDYALATAIDLADEGDWWVLLEDLHHTPSAASTLTLLTRYARQSRWLVTTRVAPDANLPGQMLALPGLSEKELTALANRIDPDLSKAKRDAVVGDSHGSPWSLLQRLTGEDAQAAVDPIADLPPVSRHFVQALSLLEQRVPPSCIERAVELPEPHLLEDLERRGLIIMDEGGCGLHPVARPLVQASLEPEPRRAAAEQLALYIDIQSEYPTVTLEALRLQLDHCPSRASHTLNDHLDHLLNGGYALDVWRLLVSETRPLFRAARLRCAVEIGCADLDELHSIAASPEEDLDLRLLAARGLYGRNLFAETVEALQAIATAAKRDPQTHAVGLEATLLQVQTLTVMGQHHKAIAVAHELGELEEPQAFFRDQGLAMAFIAQGELEQAKSQLDSLRSRLPTLPPERRPLATYTLVRLFYTSQRLRDAFQVLEQARNTLGRGTMSLAYGRKLAFVRAALAMEGGQLEQARQLFERLQGFLDHSPAWLVMLRNAMLQIHWFADPYEGIDQTAQALREEAHRVGTQVIDDALEMFDISTATDGGHAPTEPMPLELPTEPSKRHLAFLRLHHHIRHGAQLPDFIDDRSQGWMFKDRVMCTINLCFEAAMEGAHGVGARWMKLVEELDHEGYTLIQLEVLRKGVDVAVMTQDTALLEQCLLRLRQAAEQMPAPRAAVAARFVSATLHSTPARIADLEQLAVSMAQGPVVARRARALLGDHPHLDEVDRRVLAHIRNQPHWREPVTHPPLQPNTPWIPSWGLDLDRRMVWLPSGETINLSEQALLWDLLAFLYRQPAHMADKESLILKVWGERLYNPALHDNRLRLAVRKIRAHIEPDPSNPMRLITVEGGYALNAPLRTVGGTCRQDA
ncbi:MAG: winged helix-turn-helix domain-containing protein, partial [Myxococcota bacterium]